MAFTYQITKAQPGILRLCLSDLGCSNYLLRTYYTCNLAGNWKLEERPFSVYSVCSAFPDPLMLTTISTANRQVPRASLNRFCRLPLDFARASFLLLLLTTTILLFLL